MLISFQASILYNDAGIAEVLYILNLICVYTYKDYIILDVHMCVSKLHI